MRKMSLVTKILIGLILGVVVGIIFGKQATIVKPLGDLFMRLINMIIAPLVLSTLVVGTASLGDIKRLGRIGGKTIAYYLITTAVAVVIGLILATVVQPGVGLQLPLPAAQKVTEIPSVINTFLAIIPTNPIQALASATMLQIISFALFLGIAIALVGEKGQPLLNVFDSLAEVMYRITGMVMAFAPIGVFGLMAPTVGTYGLKVLLPLISLIIVVAVGCILHAIIVYSATVSILARVSPLKFFRGSFEATMVAFSSCSSSGTLPITMKCAEKNLGVSSKICSFVLPLGATINMDGSALYQGVCALFIAQVYGIHLGVSQMLMVILASTLGSIGAAGVPGAGLIMLTMVLGAVGLPLEGMALVAGVDRVLDMFRTSINVTGDLSAAVVIAASEKEIDRTVFQPGTNQLSAK